MTTVAIDIDDLEEIHEILKELWSEKPYRNPVLAEDDFLWYVALYRVRICNILGIPPAPDDVSWTAPLADLHLEK